MTEWYNQTELEKTTDAFGKYSISDFWKWWSDSHSVWMEIRTKEWEFAKELGERFSVPYSHTGVFVDNEYDFKKIILYARNKQTIWFGINPRKWALGKWGKKSISGGDNFVDSIKFIFIDIDRAFKEAPATQDQLRQCELASNLILDKFATQKWANYCKICSGNGIQLLIKLDVPIDMPAVDYEKIENQFSYIPNVQFDKAKRLILEAIGYPIIKYIRRVGAKLDIIIDKAGFRISQVGALPFTKNYKYGGWRWRGILDIKDLMINDGLSDYILLKEDNVKIYDERNFFKRESKVEVETKNRISKETFMNHKLVRFMLDNDLPTGMRNNYLWFSLKCLARDYGMLNSEVFLEVHRKLEAKWNDKLAMNLPKGRYKFKETIVNAYCISNKLPPLYSDKLSLKVRISEDYLCIKDRKDDDDSWVMDKNARITANYSLPVGDTILEDMKNTKSKMKLGEYKNREIFGMFLDACYKKYGDEQTDYYMKYIFLDFFTRR